MKISERENNSFNGSYYGYHDEMDAKSVPLYFKLLVGLCVLIIFAGVGFGIYLCQDNTDIIGYVVIGILIVVFPFVHLLMVLFDKIKYGEVRKECKTIGPIFSGVGGLLLIGLILSRFVFWGIVCGVGAVLLFYAIGISLCVIGARNGKREREHCTVPIKALCSGYEKLNPHMPILNEEGATFSQNEVVARTEVARPVWEFEYNGQLIHATPDHYEGKIKIIEGKKYTIYLNPQNPQEIFCELNSNSKFLLTMGKIWLVICTIMVIVLSGTMLLIKMYG